MSGLIFNIAPSARIEPPARTVNTTIGVRPAPRDMRSVETADAARLLGITTPDLLPNSTAGLLPGAIEYARKLSALATELATNSTDGVTADDLARLGLHRLQELKAARTAAREFDDYSLNKFFDEK